VILIEAGPSDVGRAEVLQLRRWLSLFRNPAVSVAYPIAAQAWGPSGLNHSRARILGGCSSHNGAIALRPPDGDFHRWEAEGAAGWGPADTATAWERVREQVAIAPPASRNPLGEAVLAAAEQLGLAQIDRFGRGCPPGIGRLTLNVRDGIRQSSSVAYLHPFSALPPNLTVLTSTAVEAIDLDDGGRAHRVRTARGNVLAEREVVLCAGAFETPKLLMLSGIGPREELRRRGIDVRVERVGVGRHLLDHPETLVTWGAARPVPLEGDSFWELALFTEIEHGSLMAHVGTVPVVPPGYTLPAHGLSIAPNAADARSEGEVRLRSADPGDPPVVDPRYLTDAAGRDLAVLVAGIMLARRLAGAQALAPWLSAEVCPGPGVSSPEQLADYVRRELSTVHHPAGTARMGAPFGEGSVVDPHLRVIGVQGLRVADASVFPALPSVNPCLTCMMIGERAAELVAEALERAALQQPVS
jgi:choline dehydrogenase-like flavoprotein